MIARRVQAWMPSPPRGLIMFFIVVVLEDTRNDKRTKRNSELELSPLMHAKFEITPTKIYATLYNIRVRVATRPRNLEPSSRPGGGRLRRDRNRVSGYPCTRDYHTLFAPLLAFQRRRMRGKRASGYPGTRVPGLPYTICV